MKKIDVQLLRNLFRYNSKTGILHWKKTGGKHKSGDKVGSISNGRLRVCILYEDYLVHRIIWAMHFGEFPVNVIDHIDGNPLNNRIDEIRDVNVKTNNEDRGKPEKHNSAGFHGVKLHGCGRFGAFITSNSKKKYLGYFDTPQEAHEVFLNAKRQLHKGCCI